MSAWSRGRATATGLVVVALAAVAAPEPTSVPRKPLTPMPTDAQCPALGPVLRPPPFRPGESLEFDVDALGARAASMAMRVGPARPDGRWPVEIEVETNTFFSKVRQVQGVGHSTLDPRTLRPVQYREESVENGVHRTAEVGYARPHEVTLVDTSGGRVTQVTFRAGNDVSDVVGAIPLLRSLPLSAGRSVCFDAYGVRRLWRVWGSVVAREHVSLPVGEFEAWHFVGEAARLDQPTQRREIHLWVTDDARRLPLAAIGVIDLGAVRATLKFFSRPFEKGGKAEPRGNLTW